VPDVWKSTTTVSGELFVMTTSMTSLQESHATVSASGDDDIFLIRQTLVCVLLDI